MVQDLLRFAINSNKDKSSKTLKFVKDSLKSFKKGNSRNIKTIMDFALLPFPYLQKFEKFIRAFESCKLPGQGQLSLRQLRKKMSKIEFPIDFLKKHLEADAKERESLLDQVLKRNLSYPEYRSRMVKSGQLHNVKKNVDQVTGKAFRDLLEEHPVGLADEKLTDFVGAHNKRDKENIKFQRLKTHIFETQEGTPEQGEKPDLVEYTDLEGNDSLLWLNDVTLPGKSVIVADVGQDIGKRAVSQLKDLLKDDSEASLLGVFIRFAFTFYSQCYISNKF